MNLRPNKHGKKGEVNIVPLVDVLTVLIFFFLLTMQFKDIYVVDITPPKMESSDSDSLRQPNTISVSKSGQYFYNSKEIGRDELKSELEKLSLSADPSLILCADKDVPLHYVTSVIDLVKLSKIKKLSLQTDK